MEGVIWCNNLSAIVLSLKIPEYLYFLVLSCRVAVNFLNAILDIQIDRQTLIVEQLRYYLRIAALLSYNYRL